MTHRKQLRPPLNFSIRDLWNGHTSKAVAKKLALAKEELEEQERDKLESRTEVSEEL